MHGMNIIIISITYIYSTVPQFQIPVRNQQFNLNFATASKDFSVIFPSTEPSKYYYFGISCWLLWLLWLTAWSAANVRQRAAIDRCPSTSDFKDANLRNDKTLKIQTKSEKLSFTANKEFCESLLRNV
jgi:hypothetical protein